MRLQVSLQRCCLGLLGILFQPQTLHFHFIFYASIQGANSCKGSLLEYIALRPLVILYHFQMFLPNFSCLVSSLSTLCPPLWRLLKISSLKVNVTPMMNKLLLMTL